MLARVSLLLIVVLVALQASPSVELARLRTSLWPHSQMALSLGNAPPQSPQPRETAPVTSPQTAPIAKPSRTPQTAPIATPSRKVKTPATVKPCPPKAYVKPRHKAEAWQLPGSW